MALTYAGFNDLVRLAHAGGGFTLQARGWPIDQLIRIANAAKTGNARVTFQGMGGVGIDDLIRVAHAGGGTVVIDD